MASAWVIPALMYMISPLTTADPAFGGGDDGGDGAGGGAGGSDNTTLQTAIITVGVGTITGTFEYRPEVNPVMAVIAAASVNRAAVCAEIGPTKSRWVYDG